MKQLSDEQVIRIYTKWKAIAGSTHAALMRAAVAKFCKINGIDEAQPAADDKAAQIENAMVLVAWGYRNPSGEIIDCITLEEHAKHEGLYTIPLYAAPFHPI